MIRRDSQNDTNRYLLSAEIVAWYTQLCSSVLEVCKHARDNKWPNLLQNYRGLPKGWHKQKYPLSLAEGRRLQRAGIQGLERMEAVY